MPPILLVTSISRASRYLISILLSLPDCPAIRIIAHSDLNIQESIPPLLRSAPHSIFVADHHPEREFEVAFQGVSVIFHNRSTVYAHEQSTSLEVIDMARKAGVKHFILCSVFDAIRTKIHTHKIKLAVEEYLVESRLNYTIIQPSHYMQNLSLENVVRSGIIPLGFSSSIVHGFVDLFDFAMVVRNVILAPARHNLARYELIGQNMSYDDIARTIARVCRKDIQCDTLSSKEYVTRMKANGEIKTEYSEDAIERMIVYYDRWGVAGSTNVLRWVLGREPTTWEDYIKREVQHL